MKRKVITGYITTICQLRSGVLLLSQNYDSKIHSPYFVDNAILTLLGMLSIIYFRT